ncbi:MAG: hypothetical protein K2X44_04550, partial [Magnetospirillum sp.]|nr:hypothetical protein [Magnetospirillum sp.]
MSEAPPDFRALARRYLDLWQEQVAAMANDPALADAVAQGITMMTQMPAALLQAATASAAYPVNEARAADAGTPTVTATESSAPRPQAAAAAPDGTRIDVDGITRRLAAVEERLAALEAQFGSGSGSPAEKPGRRRPK